MATYESYKKVTNEQIIDGTVTEDKLGTDVRHRLCTKWLIGMVSVQQDAVVYGQCPDVQDVCS